MFNHSIDISRLTVHAGQIVEEKHRQVGRELKLSRVEDLNSSKNIFEVNDKPRLKKKYSNQVPSNTLKVNKCKGSTRIPQEGKGSSLC